MQSRTGNCFDLKPYEKNRVCCFLYDKDDNILKSEACFKGTCELSGKSDRVAKLS